MPEGAIEVTRNAARELLLTRRGLLFLPVGQGGARAREIEAVLLELAALGYVASARLRIALEGQSTAQLATLREQTIAALAKQLGANQTHTPLFRKFPRGIPRDTQALWFQRVLSHFIQLPDQPCLFCRQQGTTHVLRPCEHVVCDRCYDGANYSACPICNRHVDRRSPFFEPDELREAPNERIRFELVDLGDDLDATARALFGDFCARTQALSPADKADFTALIDSIGAYPDRLLAWLPEQIPLKENVALILGRAFALLPVEQVLPVARARLRTATDVLRLIAVCSGADAALQGATVYDDQIRRYVDEPWWPTWAAQATPQLRRRYETMTYRVAIPRQVRRFPMAKLRRPFRRALLEILDGFERESLIEDMLRHRSYWVWAGEFLHPGEYKKRYPKVAEAFAFVRRKSPDGVVAGKFRGYYAQLELAAASGDGQAMAALLARRPGELGRRFDHLLRVAKSDPDASTHALALFCSKVGEFSNPVLLTLYSALPTRAKRAKRRMFWPKGEVARGVTIADRRPTLPPIVIATASAAIGEELLRRFADQPRFATAIIDDALVDIVAPFNERTASSTAVDLPRGSTLSIPPGKLMRLFLHWCEREGGERTDIDLSVGFYDDAWNHVGVCSYYQLEFASNGRSIARSSGDLTSAPYPDGASEFVDLDRAAAREAGIRYAVMVVNAYSGEPFDRLERGFAGLMLRDDPGGHHFDPRTVTLKFALRGQNGIYTPLCVDLADNTLHWLDIYSKGELAMNNVANSNASITRVCPETIDYFASGVRLDMRSLGSLHAAARCDRVIVRLAEGGAAIYERRPGESAVELHARIEARADFEAVDALPALGDQPVLALVLHGDLELPADSYIYALFREQLTTNLAAADLIGAGRK